ncbi:helix-turn-helix domain-containing protein [Xanthovirga aplysinae]|uniref:helix-turn-helix domain-containing protein n=1 Tax=Xanthovirga aplysinae TaxID=2529853 RepID=UPI001CA4333B
MVKKIIPEINKVYFINKYTLIKVLSGNGGVQVDFLNFYDWREKGIYLVKGQYIKFLSDDFIILKIEFPCELIFLHKEVRVLFLNLIPFSYINFSHCKACQKYLENIGSNNHIIDLLLASSHQWYRQNPFQASKEQYRIISNLREFIDCNYKYHLTSEELTSLFGEVSYNVNTLVKEKIGISISTLLRNRRLLESKKEMAFTNKSIKEISYDLGYKDSAYFNRVFKKATGQSPVQFRKNFDYPYRDDFSKNIMSLLQKYHTEERSLEFYARKMNLSVKALSKKVREKMNISLGKLLRLELINTSKYMLLKGVKIREISFRLGFEEPNHFSSFFKHYTGITPTDLKNEKCNF